jgi:hypothetical protein
VRKMKRDANLFAGNFTQLNTGTLRVDLVNTNTSAINITNATVAIAGIYKCREGHKNMCNV